MSEKSEVLAKYTRPTQTGVLLRKRLFKKLDQAQKRALVWISGLAGCGKTTLLSSYVETRDLPCLWYELDESDADPATFFYYMSLAAKKAAPRRRKPLPLLTPEYLQGVTTFTKRYFESLYNRLRTPHLVVFDNYQEVPAASEFHEIIRNGLSNIPEGIQVFLLSRTDPPPAFARLRANNLMKVIGWNELRLTVEECEGIVTLHTEQTPSDETIQELHEATDGWAAGLVLMLGRTKTEDIEPRSVDRQLPEEIFDYFASEVLSGMDEPIQGFLLKTALLPHMTAKMATELSGMPNADRILSGLNRNNYFTERRPRPASTYQYHPLFREFLVSRAKETFSPERLSDLCTRAARLLVDAGETGDAVALYQDAKDWNAIVEIIKTHAMTMLQQGRNRIVEEWLSTLPDNVVGHDPWLLFWKGICRLPFDPSQSRDLLERAFEIFDGDDDQFGMMLSWSGIIDSIAYALCEHGQLRRWIRLYEDRMPTLEELPPGALGARVASSMFSAMVLGWTDHPRIDRWGEYVLSLDAPETIGMKIQALLHLIVIMSWQGNFQEGVLHLDSFRELTKHHLSTLPMAAISLKQAESNFYLFAGRYSRSLKATFEGLELSRSSGIHLFDNMLLGQGVDSALATGDFATAEELLELMAPCRDSPRLLEACYYHTVKTRHALYKQDFREASAHAERAVRLALKVGTLAVIMMTSLLKARVMHGLGNEREADENLDRAFDHARRIKSPVCEFLALATEALFAIDRGQEESGLQSLRWAMALGSSKGYFHFPLIGSADAAKICMKALEAGIEVEFVQKSIRTCALIPDEPPVHLENWPWPLKIYTLGRFGLIIDDKPVQFSKKAQQKLLNMLKVVIASGGRDVKEESISDVLWPDADGDLAHKSFAPTLHRLRKMIGYQDALQLRDSRVTLDQRYCWVDTWAFERILGQAEAAWEDMSAENDAAEAVALTQKAVGMYRGPFLSDEAWESWAVPLRERLRSKFLRGVRKLGQHWETVGEWEKALDCYNRSLEADPLAEESYQHLMLCHQKLGRTADALSAYERCKKNLSAALGVDPSPATEAIRESLLSEKKS